MVSQGHFFRSKHLYTNSKSFIWWVDNWIQRPAFEPNPNFCYSQAIVFNLGQFFSQIYIIDLPDAMCMLSINRNVTIKSSANSLMYKEKGCSKNGAKGKP